MQFSQPSGCYVGSGANTTIILNIAQPIYYILHFGARNLLLLYIMSSIFRSPRPPCVPEQPGQAWRLTSNFPWWGASSNPEEIIVRFWSFIVSISWIFFEELWFEREFQQVLRFQTGSNGHSLKSTLDSHQVGGSSILSSKQERFLHSWILGLKSQLAVVAVP